MKHADITHYAISSPKLTAPITLALVTDLHETSYGPRQKNLLSAIRRRNPDLILLGGDLFDPSVRKKRSRLPDPPAGRLLSLLLCIRQP